MHRAPAFGFGAVCVKGLSIRLSGPSPCALHVCAGFLTDPLNNTIVLKTMCDELLEHCTSVDAAVFLDCCRTPFPGVEDDGVRSITPVARSVRDC